MVGFKNDISPVKLESLQFYMGDGCSIPLASIPLFAGQHRIAKVLAGRFLKGIHQIILSLQNGREAKQVVEVGPAESCGIRGDERDRLTTAQPHLHDSRESSYKCFIKALPQDLL